jgi:hypothetical protein
MTHYYMDLVDANGDIHDGEIILQQLADEAIQGD